MSTVASTTVAPCSKETMQIVEKRQQNSRALISRLPPEILSLIFAIVRDDHVDALGSYFDDVGSELWKDITHVCHLWREIAICTPTLWTRVVSSPNNNKWTREILLRSKKCLLTCIVVGSLGSCDSANGRMELMNQLGRCLAIAMREVPLRAVHKYWSSRVDAPKLQFLIIQATHEDDSSEIPFILSDSHLQAPSLLALEIENCGVDWKSGFLTSRLTHLGLDGLPPNSLLECNEFIKVLANMPFLEGIYLDHAYTQDDDTDVPPLSDDNPPCLWPRLKCLEITNDIIDIARFLNNITLPLTSKLHLFTSQPMREAAPEIPLVVDWILDHFDSEEPSDDDASWLAPPNCIRSFVLRQLDDLLVIHGYNEVLQHEHDISQEDALLVFNFMDFESDDTPLLSVTLVDAILLRLPIDSIVFLDVSLSDFYLSMSCWLTIFSSISTLEAIRLSTPRPMAFFHALHPDSGHGQFLPFPALKSISIPACMISTDYPIVAKILYERAAVGMRLLEFVFYVGASRAIPPYYVVSQFMEIIPKVGFIS